MGFCAFTGANRTMKTQRPALTKMATAPFQPRTGAFTMRASLSEAARARIAAELACDSTQRKIEDAPKPMPDAGNGSPAANAENDLRQDDSETPQEPAL
jgi:hypothetical protein